MMIKASIVMPSYNTPREYLRESIASIMNQTYRNFELIIVDDGSIEENWIFLEKIAKSDQRIKLMRNEGNKGVAYSLNKGFSEATGDYVFRMDSDDICESNRIEYTIKYMESHPEIDITGTQVSFYRKKKGRTSHFPESNEEIKVRMIITSPLCHPTVCIRRKSLEKYSLKYDLHEKAEDYQLWASAAMKNCIFSNIRKPLLMYRLHQKQITHNDTTLKGSASNIRKELIESFGLHLDKEEWNVFNDFCFGEISTEGMISVDTILSNKLIPYIPESFASQSIVQKGLSQRYYHECLRLALKGDKNIPKIFSSSKTGTYLGLITIRSFILEIGCLFSKTFYNMFVNK